MKLRPLGIGLLCSALLWQLAPTIHAAGPQQFTDIDNNWARDTILAFENTGVITVPPDGLFHPDDVVSRLDFAVWVAKTTELTPPANPQPFADEQDIPADERSSVDAARAAGFISGYPGNIFAPDQPISRIEIAVVLGRALETLGAKPYPAIFGAFLDGQSIPAWAASDASVTILQQVMYGEPTSPEASVAPLEQTTRAEALTLIERYWSVAQKLHPTLKPLPSAPPTAKTVIAGYYVNDDWGYNDLRQYGSQLNAVVYTGWSLSYAGQPAGYDSPRTFAWDAQSHTPLYAMFGINDAQVVNEILSSPAAIATSAQSMTNVAQNYTGVVIDLEGADHSLQSAFTSLVCQTASLLHAQNKQLWVAVPAETAEINAQTDPSNDWIGAYAYAAIGGCADAIAPMAYDEHWAGGSPGPVAGAPWVAEVAAYSTSQVSPSKILLGFPGYAYDWSTAARYATALNADPAMQNASGWGVPFIFDATQKEGYYTYRDTQGATHQVWVPTAQSAASAAQIAKQYNLAGVILWRMGEEAAGTWAQIHGVLG